MQVAFDAQVHELKLLMAADEKLWQLRGSVVSITPDTAADTAAPSGDMSSTFSLQEPDWTPQQVRLCTYCLPHNMRLALCVQSNLSLFKDLLAYQLVIHSLQGGSVAAVRCCEYRDCIPVIECSAYKLFCNCL